jgi:enoyl-CoA hydratase/carnithine racemase
LGPLFQMASLMLHEKRAHLSHMNAIGELCAQFRRGVLSVIRSYGADSVIKTVEAYHRFHPEASKTAWYPAVFEEIDNLQWQQLYINAEHDGNVGIITIGRESYNGDVNLEMNRAIDWLKKEGIQRVIVTGDFHLSTQLVGADTSDFFPALENEEIGFNISKSWSQTARRLHNEFKVSVGFINGKRCLGGMLELLTHCHYLISIDSADLGMPEVTLPVVPGMEGCHWPIRKARPDDWPRLLNLLLKGRQVKAKETVGWLTDYAGSLEDALKITWEIATDGDHGLKIRKLEEGAIKNIPKEINGLPPGDAATEAARKAIFQNVLSSCGAGISDALEIQAKHSAGFMSGSFCQTGSIGTEYKKTMKI